MEVYVIHLVCLYDQQWSIDLCYDMQYVTLSLEEELHSGDH